MRLTRSLATVPIVLTLAGCDRFGPVACTADLRPGIEVEIRSAVTGSFLAQEASASATDGAYRDSLRLSRGELVSGQMLWIARSGAFERAGTYRIEVSAPGHVTWVREGVRVREDECHVLTVKLVARLQPTAP